MIQVQIISDLHVEFDWHLPFIDPRTEILVIAGDLAPVFYKDVFERFIRLLTEQNPNLIILFVAGNHEYYTASIKKVNSFLTNFSNEHENFHFLNNTNFVHKGINFIGSTLWTDFKAFNPHKNTIANIKEYVNDFRMITGANGLLSSTEIRRMFDESVKAIKTLKSQTMLNIIITHFGCSERSHHSRYKDTEVSGYFMSNCEYLMDETVRMWIHGHTHSTMIYNIADTRIVCNPKGYYDENPEYDETLLVTI